MDIAIKFFNGFRKKNVDKVVKSIRKISIGRLRASFSENMVLFVILNGFLNRSTLSAEKFLDLIFEHLGLDFLKVRLWIIGK